MSGGGDDFRSQIRASDGRWPAVPEWWSYSSLREAEVCPRRWALSRAHYPEIWSRQGYPPRPFSAALLGDVVHRVLESVLCAFSANAVPSTGDPAAVDTLRQLGGYSQLALAAIEEKLDSLQANPRARPLIEALRSRLQAKIPEIRQRAQQILSRTVLQPHLESRGGSATASERVPLPRGSHAEVELRAPRLRLAGRADLVTISGAGCEITDYKTGTVDEHHVEQLQTYAVLWARDRDINPLSLPVTRLTVAYSTSDMDIHPPDEAAIVELANEIEHRIAHAEASVGERPPPANPSASVCRFCSVRQMCEAYWSRREDRDFGLPGPETADWFDYEGAVTSQNGPRSWLLADADGGQLLLRTGAEQTEFVVGDRLRILGLLRGHDPDSPAAIGSLTPGSEIFVLV